MAAKKRTVKGWTPADEKSLRAMIKEGTPTSKIAKALKRSAASIRSKAQKHGLSLKPKPAARAKRAR